MNAGCLPDPLSDSKQSINDFLQGLELMSFILPRWETAQAKNKALLISISPGPGATLLLSSITASLENLELGCLGLALSTQRKARASWSIPKAKAGTALDAEAGGHP